MISCRFTTPGLAIALLWPATGAAAPAPERTPRLATVQVVATRIEQPAARIPASVSVVEGDALERPVQRRRPGPRDSAVDSRVDRKKLVRFAHLTDRLWRRAPL